MAGIAVRRLMRGEDGAIRVALVDLQTLQEVTDPQGYTVIEPNNGTIEDVAISDMPQSSQVIATADEVPPNVKTVQEAREILGGGKQDMGDAATGMKGAQRDITNDFGYKDKPTGMGLASALPGPLGMAGKAVNAAWNANNLAAGNAARSVLGLPERSNFANVKGIVSDVGNVVSEKANIGGNDYQIGFGGISEDGKTTQLTPNEARTRSLTMDAPISESGVSERGFGYRPSQDTTVSPSVQAKGTLGAPSYTETGTKQGIAGRFGGVEAQSLGTVPDAATPESMRDMPDISAPAGADPDVDADMAGRMSLAGAGSYGGVAPREVSTKSVGSPVSQENVDIDQGDTGAAGFDTTAPSTPTSKNQEQSFSQYMDTRAKYEAEQAAKGTPTPGTQVTASAAERAQSNLAKNPGLAGVRDVGTGAKSTKGLSARDALASPVARDTLAGTNAATVNAGQAMSPAAFSATGLGRQYSAEERAAMAKTLAGELSPGTLKGLVANNPEAIAEAAAALGTMDNRVNSTVEASKANPVDSALRGSQYNANMTSPLKSGVVPSETTAANYNKYGVTLDTLVDDYVSGKISSPAPDATHYANLDVASPEWGTRIADKFGPHTFGTPDATYTKSQDYGKAYGPVSGATVQDAAGRSVPSASIAGARDYGFTGQTRGSVKENALTGSLGLGGGYVSDVGVSGVSTSERSAVSSPGGQTGFGRTEAKSMDAPGSGTSAHAGEARGGLGGLSGGGLGGKAADGPKGQESYGGSAAKGGRVGSGGYGLGGGMKSQPSTMGGRVGTGGFSGSTVSDKPDGRKGQESYGGGSTSSSKSSGSASSSKTDSRGGMSSGRGMGGFN